MIEVGRLCVKTAGREAGKLCTIVKKLDESFVLITGPKEITRIKRRRCNIVHLEPLKEKIKIKADASDAEILAEYHKEGIFEKYKLEVKEKAKEPEERPKEKQEEMVEKPKEEKPEKKPKVAKKAKKEETKESEKPEEKAKKPRRARKPKSAETEQKEGEKTSE